MLSKTLLSGELLKPEPYHYEVASIEHCAMGLLAKTLCHWLWLCAIGLVANLGLGLWLWFGLCAIGFGILSLGFWFGLCTIGFEILNHWLVVLGFEARKFGQ